MELLAILLAFLSLDTPKPKRWCKEQIKVAIVDTGLDLKDPRFEGSLCKTGHYNFVNKNTDTKDLDGHGTHVAGLIQKEAGYGNYCFLIYKFYKEDVDGKTNLRNEVKSFRKAVDNGATLVNFSGGGPEFSEDEFLAIRDAKDVTFVVAAGNEGVNIDYVQNYYYPASIRLPNVIPVGNVDKYGTRHPSSNYGLTVKATEIGVEVSSYEIGNGYRVMTGTSQAAAIHTGKILREKLDSCDIGVQ